VATFRAQVLTLAAACRRERVLNMCTDRYWFAVALFAAIARNMVTVLPNSAAPEHIAAVVEQPGLLVLGDQAEPGGPAYMQINTLPPRMELAPPCRRFPSISAWPVCIPRAPPARPCRISNLWPSAAGHSGRSRAGVGCGRTACSVVGTVPIRHMYGLESSVLLPIFAGGRMSGAFRFSPQTLPMRWPRCPRRVCW
jgi:hypothetical protein